MRDITIRSILIRMRQLGENEVLPKLKAMEVNEAKDRLRIIFEFELNGAATVDTPPIIKDAVEIRHRRPWE